MEYVAAKSLPSSEVVLMNPAFDYVSDRKSSFGRITVEAEARKSETLSKLREVLNDKEHETTGDGPKQIPNKKAEYGFVERETIQLAPKGWNPLAKPVAAKPVATTAAADSDKPADAKAPTPSDSAETKGKSRPSRRGDSRSGPRPESKSTSEPEAKPDSQPQPESQTQPPAATPDAVTQS